LQAIKVADMVSHHEQRKAKKLMIDRCNTKQHACPKCNHTPSTRQMDRSLLVLIVSLHCLVHLLAAVLV
jgi:hypothetical protein